MKPCFRHFFLLALLASGVSSAQVSTGTPPFGTFGGGPFDTVNLGNLNVHFAIPVLHKSGRVMPFIYDLSYDSSVWTPVTLNGAAQWQPDTNWGWKGNTEAAIGYVLQTAQQRTCGFGRNKYVYEVYDTLGYGDQFGVFHPVFIETDTDLNQNCGNGNRTGAQTSADGSGYNLSVSNFHAVAVTSISGSILNPPINKTAPPGGSLKDANGNQITQNTSGQFFDTLSSTTPVLTVSSAAPPTATTFTYTAPSGASASYTMKYLQYTVKTGFGVSGVTEYGPLSNSLVSSIELPDGSSY